MIKFEICEVLNETQQFIVCFESVDGHKHELSVDFPDTELSDDALLSYIAQFAPRSITRPRIVSGQFDHLIGKHNAEPKQQVERPQLLRID